MTYTEKIYSVIKDNCLKQSAVAKKAGFTTKDFNNILRGRKIFRADYVRPICEALAITPNELFSVDIAEKED